MRVGHQPVGGTSDKFGTIINSEIARWKKVIQEAEIKAD
jgi:hypothetical protein